MKSELNFVYRAFLGTWDNDAALAKTLDALDKAAPRNHVLVWIRALGAESHHRRNFRNAIAQAKRSRASGARGLDVGLNVHTVGFTYSPADEHDFGFQYQVGIDLGRNNHNSACPLCPTFRRHLSDHFGRLAIPGLDYLLIDDDFNYMVGGSACYCPLHMKSFSAKAGREFTAEQWVATMKSPGFKPGELGRAWHDTQTEALLGAFKVIEKATHDRQPSMRLGPMGVNAWVCDFGTEPAGKLFEIARGPARVAPVCRPSAGAYWDWHRLQGHGAISPWAELYSRTIIPQDVTGFLEMDFAAPWTTFEHGPEHARYILERCAALGSRDFAFIFSPDGPGDALEPESPFCKMIAAARPKLDAIAELVEPKPRFEGVDARIANGTGAVDPMADHCFGIPAFPLSRIGLPLAPTGEWVPVVYRRLPMLLGAAGLRDYVKNGAIIDGQAIGFVAELGCHDLIGDANVAAWDDSPVGLVMSNHKLNGPAAGRHFSNLGPLRRSGTCRKLLGTFRDEDVLSWWVDTNFKRVGPAELAIERDGRRMILLSHDLDQQTPDRQVLVANPLRAAFFRNACEWVARRPLPAVLIDTSDVELYYMRPRDSDARRVVALVNNGFNRYEKLTMEMDTIPSGPRCSVRTASTDGKIIAAVGIEMKQLQNRVRVILPADLAPAPFEVRVLSFE